MLVRLLGKTPLDFVALTSSVSSVLGTPGVCDYAGANAVLDAFPESKSCPAILETCREHRLGTLARPRYGRKVV